MYQACVLLKQSEAFMGVRCIRHWAAQETTDNAA